MKLHLPVALRKSVLLLCVAALGDALAAHGTDYYTCHCTGVEQYAFLRGRMPRLRYLAGGETVIL